MKVKIIPIASGSTGNSMFIDLNDYRLLIDVGVSYTRIKKALFNNGYSIDDIDASFISHNHTDHIGGLQVFNKNYKGVVCASFQTHNQIKVDNPLALDYDTRYEIFDGLFVTLCKTSHDAKGSCGFIFEYKDVKIGYVTDLGYIDSYIIGYLFDADIIVIESNHDIQKLKTGIYPYYLKQRILSKTGHLSNESCSLAIKELLKGKTKYFLLAHLSQENNTPELALNEVWSTIDVSDIDVECLPVLSTNIIEYDL